MALAQGPGTAQFTQQGAELAGTDGQGVNVALSADGNTAIVGGNESTATIYTRKNGAWSAGQQFIQSDKVALSADGKTVIMGMPATGAAPVVVYALVKGVWTQQGNLVGTGAVGDAAQGFSVALSADGNTAIIGGPSDNFDSGSGRGTGAAWVFTRSGGVWTQQGNKLVGTGAVGAASQGWSVALSADGNTAIVGGPDDIFDSSIGGGTGAGSTPVPAL